MTIAELINDNGGNAAFFRLFKRRIPLSTIEGWKGIGSNARKSTPWMAWVLGLAVKQLKCEERNGPKN